MFRPSLVSSTHKRFFMTPEEKFKKDMQFLQENLRRTFNPTWYERILEQILFFPNLAIILITILIITLILS
jgi:hypothetical protein